MAQIQRGFSAPPEIARYMDDKGWQPAFNWKDVFGDENANAFAIAKVTELELGSAFKRSLMRAREQGEGFETWRKQVVQDLRAIGWGLPRHVADPTGKTDGEVVDFTSRRRLETIFWGNMASARAAGQWERAQRSKFALPYFLYLRTTSANPREAHLRWVGLIRPVDDPIWSSIFPPNGWRCKCGVRQISAREAAALLGREWKEGDVRYTDEAPEIVMREWTNKRTGEVLKVPKGCDPGWGGNPGLARVKGVMRAVEQTLVEAPPADATRMLDELWQSPWTRVVARLPEDQAKEVWLPAGVSHQLQATLKAKSPVVSISGADVVQRSNLDKRYTDGRGYDDLTKLPRAIAEGRYGPDPRGKASTRSFIWQEVKRWWRGFVTKSGTGYLRVTSFHQREAGAAQREREE